MNLDDAIPGFIAESADLLRDMESALLECTAASATPEAINLIFRSAHTIKGSAGLFGLNDIVSFVHVVETVLDRVRLGRIAMNDELIALLLSCKDHIHELVACIGTDPQGDPDLQGQGQILLAALHGISAGNNAGAGKESQGATPIETAAVEAASQSEHNEVKSASHLPASQSAVLRDWKVTIHFAPGVLTAGMDPLGFIRYLRTFSELRRMQILQDALPEVDAFNAESCYLGFELELRTDADRARIEGAFEFVRGDCTLDISQIGAPTSASPPGTRDPVAAHSPAAVPCPPTSVTLEDTFQTGPPAYASAAGPGPTQPDTKVEQPASAGRANSSTDGRMLSRSIRVDADKLDHLITRIGELIIAAAGVNLLARNGTNGELEERTSTLTDLVEQVRESALQLRMVKIGGTFDRFKRVVHDVSRELGKDITLILHGEDTELDKTVVEHIADPLTHLVRNAIDHGIEPADVRRARGKPPGGTIMLNAFHDSGSIVIEVKDDGGGLRRDKILAKAHERGLIQDDRVLTDSEIFNLVFEPGFSTADQVTNLSGRGVGMDVVKRNITGLRGTVGISSVDGQGTTVTVRLPLTLAIINGFQVGVGKSSFVLPLDAIEECIEYSAESGHDFTNLRGQVLPFVRLRELVGTREPEARRPSIVVVKHAGERAGVVVDSLFGEFQTVIKPLGKMFRKVDFVSGSSILGNGEVALILDVPALVQQAVMRSRSAAASRN